SMSNFHSLTETVRALRAWTSTPGGDVALRPLARGEFASAAVVRASPITGGLHRQPNHEELVIVLDGEADFRGADEVRRVRRGDLVFVPRNAQHGVVATHAEPLLFLSILTPQFDLARDVVWEGNVGTPRFNWV